MTIAMSTARKSPKNLSSSIFRHNIKDLSTIASLDKAPNQPVPLPQETTQTRNRSKTATETRTEAETLVAQSLGFIILKRGTPSLHWVRTTEPATRHFNDFLQILTPCLRDLKKNIY